RIFHTKVFASNVTATWTYDFGPEPGCSASRTTNCIDHFEVEDITNQQNFVLIQEVANPSPAVGKVDRISTSFKYGPPFGQRAINCLKIKHLRFGHVERKLQSCKWVVDRPIGPGGLPVRLKWLLLLLPIFLCAALPAKADQDYVWVNGSYSSVSNGFAIGPYGGSVNGSPSQFYCVDFKDQISGNTGWSANVTGLTSSSGYGQTLEKNGTSYLK